MSTPISGVNPEILIWARNRAGLSVPEVAQAMKKEPAVIQAWEVGESSPTYVQLERLAYKIFKRPIAIFFFPDPPEEPDAEQSFRTLPDFEVEALSDDTRFKVRKARGLQLSLAELFEGRNPTERQIFRDVSISRESDPAAAAEEVRRYVGIDLDEQKRWRYRRSAMKRWRTAVEEVGVFVFKDTFKQREISGFCLLDDEFPVIYANNTTPFSRQIFTLFHELAHILLRTNGITKQDDSYIQSLTGSSRGIEVFCNAFAAELLVPSADFEDVFSGSYDEAEVEALSDRYCVSREVVLRKLLDRGIVSAHFYRSKVRQWWDEYQASGRDEDSGGRETEGGNYYATQAAYLGERYLKAAFSRYYQGRISIEQLAEHLNVKVSSVAGLELLGLR